MLLFGEIGDIVILWLAVSVAFLDFVHCSLDSLSDVAPYGLWCPFVIWSVVAVDSVLISLSVFMFSQYGSM
jgi:hypothetical protein